LLDKFNNTAVSFNNFLKKHSLRLLNTSTLREDKIKISNDILDFFKNRIIKGQEENYKNKFKYLMYTLAYELNPNHNDLIYFMENLKNSSYLLDWTWAIGEDENYSSLNKKHNDVILKGYSNFKKLNNSLSIICSKSKFNRHLRDDFSGYPMRMELKLDRNTKYYSTSKIITNSTFVQKKYSDARKVVLRNFLKMEKCRMELIFHAKEYKLIPATGSLAFGVLLQSALDGFETDPYVSILGNLLPNGDIEPEKGGTGLKLRSLVNKVSDIVLVPAKNADKVYDFTLMFPKEAGLIQVLSVNSFQDALKFSKSQKDEDTIKAFDIYFNFSEQLSSKGISIFRQGDTENALNKILKLLPQHLSARVFLDIYYKKKIKKLSYFSSCYFLARIFNPLNKYKSMINSPNHMDDPVKKEFLKVKNDFQKIKLRIHPNAVELYKAYYSYSEYFRKYFELIKWDKRNIGSSSKALSDIEKKLANLNMIIRKPLVKKTFEFSEMEDVKDYGF